MAGRLKSVAGRSWKEAQVCRLSEGKKGEVPAGAAYSAKQNRAGLGQDVKGEHQMKHW